KKYTRCVIKGPEDEHQLSEVLNEVLAGSIEYQWEVENNGNYTVTIIDDKAEVMVRQLLRTEKEGFQFIEYIPPHQEEYTAAIQTKIAQYEADGALGCYQLGASAYQNRVKLSTWDSRIGQIVEHAAPKITQREQPKEDKASSDGPQPAQQPKPAQQPQSA